MDRLDTSTFDAVPASLVRPDAPPFPLNDEQVEAVAVMSKQKPVFVHALLESRKPDLPPLKSIEAVCRALDASALGPLAAGIRARVTKRAPWAP